MDPCASDDFDRPDRYLDYDVQTGEIIPRNGLTGDARRKAVHTIKDLGLNSVDVMYYRFDQTRRFTADLMELPVADQAPFIKLFTERLVEYAGVNGMIVEQLQRDGRIR